MVNKIKNLKTGLISVVSSLIVCFCLISLVNASDEGLIAYYSFDEGEGNVLHDYSRNSNDGTIYGAKWVDGKYGKALSFDGIDDYVDCGNDATLNPEREITVEAWYKPISFSGTGNDPIIGKGYYSHTYPHYQYHLGVSGDTYSNYNAMFGLSVAAGGSSKTSGTNNGFWIAGSWYHLAGTYDGTKVKFYVNGVLISSTPASGVISNYGKNVYLAKFSNKFSNLEHYLPGTIDEVRIYNRALTESEIKADMVSSSPEMMKKIIQATISKTQTKIDQLKKENINTKTIEKIITSAEDALQKEAYKTALEQAQDASSKADKVWNAFQSYNIVKREVDAKVDQLKREDIDTAIIEKSLSEAKSAFENENFELAHRLVSDAESKADKSWSTYQYIETAKNAVKEAKGINCDASNAEKRVNDAVDALNKGSYDVARQYASNAVSLANKANCGKINIKDLKALSVKYDGRTVEISGKVRDIGTVYGKGYKFTVDDGTGLIVVGYEGSMKDVNNGDTVNVKGVFSRSNDAVIAEKVEKSGIIDILPGGDGSSGGGNLLFLLIGGVIIIVVVVVALFILKKNKNEEKGRRDVGERI